MNEQLLYDLRTEPSPAFAEQLGQRLAAQPPVRLAATRHWVWTRMLAPVGAIAIVALLFTLPAVRASAQAFLDLFRVTNFAPIQVDQARVDQLRALELDPIHLLGNDVTVLQDSGPPLTVSSVADAAGLARMEVRLPSSLPPNTTQAEVRVVGERAATLGIRTDRLRGVLDALGIRDIDVPQEFNGQQVRVQIPPVVRVRYVQGIREAELFQARAPIVELPQGLDLPRLGEMALRILGLPSREARNLAAQTDWHSTLLVPVPPDATEIHRVQIGNASANGLAIQTAPRPNGTARAERVELIVWSTGDRVYGLQGTIAATSLLEMAHSIH